LCTTLYIGLAVLYRKYTGARENDSTADGQASRSHCCRISARSPGWGRTRWPGRAVATRPWQRLLGVSRLLPHRPPDGALCRSGRSGHATRPTGGRHARLGRTALGRTWATGRRTPKKRQKNISLATMIRDPATRCERRGGNETRRWRGRRRWSSRGALPTARFSQALRGKSQNRAIVTRPRRPTTREGKNHRVDPNSGPTLRL
jgi:hypothetical protein